jgi:cell division topological specificity factor
MAGSHSDLLNLLREEIVDVIARHIKVDRDKVNIKLDRGEEVSTLEIDVEMPAAIPLVKAQGAEAA